MVASSFIYEIKLDRFTFLLNGLNGCSDIIQSSLWEKVKKGKYMNFYKNTIKDLKDRKFIFEDKNEELKLYNDSSTKLEQRLFQDKRRIISINISEDCNLSCPYCISSKRRSQKMLSKAHIDKIVALLNSFEKKYNVIPRITLFGGEPLMLRNRHIFEYLIKKIEGTKFKLHIITNGVTIDKYLDLINENSDKFQFFQITLDGPPEIHNRTRISKKYPKTFKLITGNIQRLLDLNFKVRVRTNLNKASLEKLPKLARFIKKKKWDKYKNFRGNMGLISTYQLKFCKNNPRSNSVKYIKQFRQLKKKHPELSLYNECDLYTQADKLITNSLKDKTNKPMISYCTTINSRHFTFASDNQIYNCFAAVGIKDFSIGTYFPKLKWNKNNLAIWKTRVSTQMDKCRKCPLVFVCGGNCPLHAYEKNGNINKPVCAGGIKDLEAFVKLNKDKILKKAGIYKKR